MHLSSLFDSKDGLAITIKSCLHKELPEASREHCRELFKQLALYEIDIISILPISDERMEAGVDKLETNSELYLVAYHYDLPVGLLVSRKENPNEIMAMHVTKEYRGKNIGNLLVQQFIRLTRTPTIEVTCLTVNSGAMRFYEKLGFEFDKAMPISRGVLTIK